MSKFISLASIPVTLMPVGLTFKATLASFLFFVLAWNERNSCI